MKNNGQNIEIASKKVVRDFPQNWEYEGDREYKYKQVDREFGVFCDKLYSSFLGIKKYYEKEFNEDNTYTIDEYIQLFNRAYDKVLKTLYKENSMENFKDLRIGEENKKFYVYKNRELCKKEAYKYDSSGKISGFSSWGYKKILPYVKEIFMLEKLCSFTTRKFWENEITKVKDLDMSKPFKILVKCVFPYTWRADGVTTELRKYYKNRIYSSTSLIDEKHMPYIFTLPKTDICAALIVEYDDKSFVCASSEDSFSEEKIDNKNKLFYKIDYSDVMLVDNTNYKKLNHKCYANAVETETPKNILNNTYRYSEINVKNAKVVGVLVPNPESLKFAQKEADERSVPLFMPQGLKEYINQNPEEFE